MNIIDVVVILTILFFGVIGFKNGFFKQTVQFFGSLLILILAYNTKNILGDIFVKYAPFFKFEGLTTLNIILYQIIAFLIMLTIFGVILQIVVSATGVIEKILKYTIILGIPSKLLGLLIGLIQGLLVSFVIVVIFSLPILPINITADSKFSDTIRNKTPIISTTNKAVNLIDDVVEIRKGYLENEDVTKFNNLTVDALLKYNVIDAELINYLNENNKL